MKLVDVYSVPRAAAASMLYQLLTERVPGINIARALPSWDDHLRFIEARPYALWNIIVNDDEEFVGAVHLTKDNEIGIFILADHRRRGYAKWAVSQIAQGPCRAVINELNDASIALFESLGFRSSHRVYEREEAAS